MLVTEIWFFKELTAISDQTNHNKFFESVASQHFQKIYWFGFERKALYFQFE
ncbi:hypothetical protein APA_2916 [Pseudanabaena sp. lw0831]|nr:hypothetical protein APA_2916 [Pseudanabaena sp. lw0831]